LGEILNKTLEALNILSHFGSHFANFYTHFASYEGTIADSETVRNEYLCGVEWQAKNWHGIGTNVRTHKGLLSKADVHGELLELNGLGFMVSLGTHHRQVPHRNGNDFGQNTKSTPFVCGICRFMKIEFKKAYIQEKRSREKKSFAHGKISLLRS
jgi:hypothetical protein